MEVLSEPFFISVFYCFNIEKNKKQQMHFKQKI